MTEKVKDVELTKIRRVESDKCVRRVAKIGIFNALSSDTINYAFAFNTNGAIECRRAQP